MENIENQKCKRGGQPGNKNALKHGFYSRENIEKRKALNSAIKEAWMHTLAQLNATNDIL